MQGRVILTESPEPGALGAYVGQLQHQAARQLVLKSPLPLLDVRRFGVRVETEQRRESQRCRLRKAVTGGEHGYDAVRLILFAADAVENEIVSGDGDLGSEIDPIARAKRRRVALEERPRQAPCQSGARRKILPVGMTGGAPANQPGTGPPMRIAQAPQVSRRFP